MSTVMDSTDQVTVRRRDFEAAFKRAFDAFHKRKRLKAYRDVSPRFWVAWLDLQAVIERQAPLDELREEFGKAYRQFGAPGDFGYGTPPGEGLKQLYNAWNELLKAAAAAKPAEAVA